MQKNSLLYRTWDKGKMNLKRIDDGLIMRWTGEFDCNGRHIYEGDIVQVKNLFSQNDVRYINIKYERKRMGWNLGEYKKAGCVFTVVGNTFERKV